MRCPNTLYWCFLAYVLPWLIQSRLYFNTRHSGTLYPRLLWSLKNFSDRMCLTDVEIMLRCVRCVQFLVNLKCLLSLKNLPFYHIPTVFDYTVTVAPLFHLCCIPVTPYLYSPALYFTWLLILYILK